MARKVVVTVVDDLDAESVAAETVSFGIDGVVLEIDLSEANAAELRAAFGKWTPFARKVGGTRRVRREKPARAVSAKAIREWARRNGHEVPQRGRIPARVVNAYQRAMG
ncbi:histone-like nucleoid-structuring protein Lsr2 [Nocardia brevicatena]|uniref:histone-like nucleoid-structuring protein Lsr2 n=1 Tax=Nocardia brevicatena TaxID=37327 RepID=UPI0003189E9B|nr:Lsr2 family protein [Nocardia brevicatena]